MKENTEAVHKDSYKKLRQRVHRRVGILLILPPLIIAMFFNFNQNLVDISGVHDFVCKNPDQLSWVHHVVPKLTRHCKDIWNLKAYGLDAIVAKDLIIVMDFFLLLCPLPLASWYCFKYRLHFGLLDYHFSHKAPRFAGTIIFLLFAAFIWFGATILMIDVLLFDAPLRYVSSWKIPFGLIDNYGIGAFWQAAGCTIIPVFVFHLIASIRLIYLRAVGTVYR